MCRWWERQPRARLWPEARKANIQSDIQTRLNKPINTSHRRSYRATTSHAMAPIRRYLRITKFSVLECRIYLDNPALAESWLLNPRNPILPRVIESVRPLVLPKLREEKERSRAKGGKKKGVKDVVVEGMGPSAVGGRQVMRKLLTRAEDFEVSIFLTETDTRHSLLTKQKHFREPNKKGIKSNSNKLTGDTTDNAIQVEDAPVIRREESEEELDLQDVPAAEDFPAVEDVSDAGSLFVGENDDQDHQMSKRSRAATDASASETSASIEPQAKRRKNAAPGEEEGDDKKKMAMSTTYEGFAIYGSVLCLVVKRKDKKGKVKERSEGQAMMEDWIASTQMPAGEEDGS